MQMHVPSLTSFPFNRSHFCLPEQAQAAFIMFNTTALLFFLVIQGSQNSALERRWIFYAPNETVLTWGMKRTQVYEEQPQQCNTVVFLYEFQQSKIGGIRGDHSDIFSNMKRSARGTPRPCCGRRLLMITMFHWRNSAIAARMTWQKIKQGHILKNTTVEKKGVKKAAFKLFYHISLSFPKNVLCHNK